MSRAPQFGFRDGSENLRKMQLEMLVICRFKCRACSAELTTQDGLHDHCAQCRSLGRVYRGDY